VNPQDTSAETKPDLPLEIAHLLLIDVVGYSKLLVNEQIELLQELNQIVRGTESFRAAETRGQLIRVPTGDGMALLFFHSPEEPVRCALEISKVLQEHPHIQVRMGVHSGPVNPVTDVNDKTNFTGSGINIAQRVMDCGDAGHILLSEHLADDLSQYRHWQPYLHDLGECEVKHGLRLHLFNLYKDNLGNPQVPNKLKRRGWKQDSARVRPVSQPQFPKFLAVALAGSALALVITSLIFFQRPRSGAITSTVSSAAPSNVPVSIPEKSVAVLPFDNLSNEKENAYFANGVQDQILTALARVADLKVISRTSTMQYKTDAPRNLREIGAALGVAHVVEGSVQRASNRVRVNAQLIDARTDLQLWAQTYDRDLADVFAIQSEIAGAIADQLQAKLSANEKSAIEQPPTTDVTAFDLYSRANTLLLAASGRSTGRDDLLEAANLLNQAVARDRSFFQAYCQLAWVHDQLYFFGLDRSPARLALADTALQAASRLRPDAGETHLARAWSLYQVRLDYKDALAQLEVASQTLPNDARIFELMGYVQRRQGLWEESTLNLERAIDLDPRNTSTLQEVALHYLFFMRRYSEAKSLLGRVLAIEPNRVDTEVFLASVDFHWKADTRPFHQMIDSIRTTNPGAVPTIAEAWLTCALAERDATGAQSALTAAGNNPINLGGQANVDRTLLEGVIARMTKDDDKARSAFTAARAEQEKIIQAEPNFAPPWGALGLIDAALGRKEEALREGRRAIELLPVARDTIRGPAMIVYLAMIAAWVGDKDRACEQLAIAIRHPSGPSYGELKLLPYWDPLRGEPCFEKTVASLAPKETPPTDARRAK
jgi:TolB-like protein/class 3 adenylate cyclase/Tfp pilus assembly protein PilF